MFGKILSLFRAREVPASASTIAPKDGPATEPAARAATLKAQADNFLMSDATALAEQCYKEAIALYPEFTDAYINLSIALRAQKKFADAASTLDKALAINPGDVYIYYNKGVLAKEQANYPAAIAEFCKAIELDGKMLDAYYDLADIYLNTGDKLKAHALMRTAVEQFPQEAGVLMLAANLDSDNQLYDNALALYNRVLALQPDKVEAMWHVSWILQKLGRLSEAEASYRKLLTIAPDLYEPNYNLGVMLDAQSRKDEAIPFYLRTLAIKPDNGTIHFNLGKAYADTGRLEEAEASYRQAIALPSVNQVQAQASLGNLLHEAGRPTEAIECYRAATLMDPNYFDAYSSVLFNLCFGDQSTPEQYQAEVHRYRDKLRSYAPAYDDWKCRPANQENRRLRVGLVSGDFGLHAVGFFLENIISQLDLQKLELYAYSNVARNDALTARIQPFFSKWNSIENLDDQSSARMIHEDRVDILIDLAGHTAHNRLPVFAFKPAPLQVSWLGYFATTGVPGMDYLLADKIAVPETHKEYFTEQIWYLPSTRLCLTPPPSAGLQSTYPLPALRNGYVTFGCFQNVRKLNDFTLQLWAKIFASLPNARLRFQCWQMGSEPARKKMLDRFARHGISADRICILGPGSREAYLAAHAEVDMILDTYPYGGGTTTCEAFWMGVPTVTLAGNTMASLQGVSLLSYAGLEDWIAKSADDYVRLATSYASDVDKLAQLRTSLRQRMLTSPLYDGQQFARNFEHALLAMWEQYSQTKKTLLAT
ncbi:tetratricopeptide repeat protein [Undibacterium sp. Di27W]|uniref:tetratricopeptide repeat protein n=1 Tax=Undibacterium sp. Di27W TaxID=3413036 RepID=UPI003BEF4FE1